MGHKFVSHFLFFIKIKQIKLKQMGQSLSTFNRFIVFWLIFLVVLNLMSSASRLFFAPIVENRLIGNSDPDFAYFWETIDLWILNVYTPITDLFTQLTFLYLFYFQAITKIESDKESAKGGSSNANSNRAMSME